MEMVPAIDASFGVAYLELPYCRDARIFVGTFAREERKNWE